MCVSWTVPFESRLACMNDKREREGRALICRLFHTDMKSMKISFFSGFFG